MTAADASRSGTTVRLELIRPCFRPRQDPIFGVLPPGSHLVQEYPVLPPGVLPHVDRLDRSRHHRHSSSSSRFGAYNRLVALRQRVDQAFADIDVQLKQRHDLIPNLVETVKGYASHERGTLDDVIKARNSAMSAQGPAQVVGRREPALRRARPPDRAVGGLSGPQGQRQLPAAGRRTLRPREQDRGQPPLLQQRGPGIQHRDPADAGCPVRRHVRLHPQGILRSRRQAREPRREQVPTVKF